MYRRMLYAYFYMKAKRCLIKKNFLCAYNNFLKAEKYNKDDYSFYIYKGVTEFFLKKFENSLFSFQTALLKVENSKKLNEDEKSYLKKYIIEFILDILKILGKKENFAEYKTIYNSLTYNKNHINKYFFYDYPL